jgi:hypothetical protein
MKNIYIYLLFLILYGIYINYKNIIYDTSNIECFNQNPIKKTVIFVVTQDIAGYIVPQMGYFWGLGDIIRGMISVYQICKELNYEFIVDMHLHPISKFFKKKDHKYENFIKDRKDSVKFTSDANEFIKNRNEHLIIYFFSNHYYDLTIPLTEDCKNFIKEIFTPTDDLEQYFNNYLKKIPYDTFNILHYRLGDDFIKNDEKQNQSNPNHINEFTYNFNENKENNDILMSDSQNFKNHIKKINNIYTFDLDIGHIGYEKDDIKIKNSLCEFLIISKAKKIKTYSIYFWISGFVKVVSSLYDIPLINLKEKPTK